ncbi:unnamed protein product [Symbiodinium natans]|uniref:SAM domain-containing protein n=1 Tax=Symbiodinium natans TaxID=878477 RepID=A0A812Q8B8_9DINO|nr:unnamed protein product [Symbiodinium natans]
MSRPPATSRKVGRAVVLLALLWVSLPEPKTSALNSVRGFPEQPQASSADGAGFARSGGRAVSKVGSSGNMGTELAGRTQGQGGLCEGSLTLAFVCRLLQAEWLKKTAGEIDLFTSEEVGYWARAVLEEANCGKETVQNITNIINSEDIMGKALLKLTLNDMQDMNIRMGPRKVLAERIAAVSLPTAEAGAKGECISCGPPLLLFGIMLSSQLGYPRR